MKLKKILCQLLYTALLFTSVVKPVPAYAENTENEESVATEVVYDSENYKISDYADGTVVPEKDGYEFAGWYTGEGDIKTPLTNRTVGEGVTAYAKFVPETVLGVRYQLTKSTYVTSDNTDLRLVTTVDSKEYREVGFYVALEGAEKPATCGSKTVYSQINGYTSDGVTHYTPSGEFNPVSKYFMCFNITDIDNSMFANKFTITPYWITMDGTIVTGDEKEINIRDTVYKGSVYGDGITVTPGVDEAQFTVVEKAVTEGTDEGKTYTTVENITTGGWASLTVAASEEAGLEANAEYTVLVTVECDGSKPSYYEESTGNAFVFGNPGGTIKFTIATDANGTFTKTWTKTYMQTKNGLTYVNFTDVKIMKSTYGTGITITPGMRDQQAVFDVTTGYTEKTGNVYESYSVIENITKGGWSTLKIAADSSAGLAANTKYTVTVTAECDGGWPSYYSETAPTFHVTNTAKTITFEVTTDANGAFTQTWDSVYVNLDGAMTYVKFTDIKLMKSAYGTGITITPGLLDQQAAFDITTGYAEKTGNVYESYSVIENITKGGWSSLKIAADNSAGLAANTKYTVTVTAECDGGWPSYYSEVAPTFHVRNTNQTITFEVTTDANGAFTQTWNRVYVNKDGNMTYVKFTDIKITKSAYGTGITITPGKLDQQAVFDVTTRYNKNGNVYENCSAIENITKGGWSMLTIAADSSAGLAANTKYTVTVTAECDGGWPSYYSETAPTFHVTNTAKTITFEVTTDANGAFTQTWNRVYVNLSGNMTYVTFTGITITPTE